MRILTVEVECWLNGRPFEPHPAEFAHPGLVLASADGRKGDVADRGSSEDVPPDEDRPAVAAAGDEVRTIARREVDGGRSVDRLHKRGVGEALKSEAETVNVRLLDCADGDFEGLRMEDVVLVGEHDIGCVDERDCCVARRSATAVRLVDDNDAAVLLRITLEHGKGVVSRTVVDAKAYPVRHGLRDDAVKQIWQECRTVVNRYDNRDFAHMFYI